MTSRWSDRIGLPRPQFDNDILLMPVSAHKCCFVVPFFLNAIANDFEISILTSLLVFGYYT